MLAERTGLGADLPRQTLLGPLGLSSAVFEPDAAGTPVCSSYLWMTPRDWAAAGQFALQDGFWNGKQLLPADWMSQSLTQPRRLRPTTSATRWASASTCCPTALRWPSLPEDTYYMSGHDGQKVLIVPSENSWSSGWGSRPRRTTGPTVVGVVEAAIAG